MAIWHSANWDEQYDAWQANCREEYTRQYGECDDVEFSEAGDAYPHGIGGIGHIRHAVTPLLDWIKQVEA